MKSTKKGKVSSKASGKTKNKTLGKALPKITPLGDRVLIDPIENDDAGGKTASGIYIPEDNKEKPETGRVIAVGVGSYDDGVLVPMQVKVGDKVVFSKYGFDEIKIDDQEYFVIKQENILAIIK
jgi:chaperonin GroES